ncbi:TPA: GDP-fucose synthetase [Candidatus Dependentiae bacterium]|nr:MAG: NAD-dependent epimerase/dehydratase [candidate division TM6 bacterium GW2011_GWE2_31_21]KKP53893.1 MAG: NAD-dependent epimerase/dehydratase [candidate division TM6 bacterium GW2011_GWF2_33_332]HBS47673.1 GDP-fucose synthetase [Candidatus Dependentiae bacterium]HBZ73822.1 GDP-fucose synthetase [Candidatus Dependentiae bacterium]
MNFDSKIYLAGHKGLVGSAILRTLQKNGYKNILTSDFEYLDLRNQKDVEMFFQTKLPEYVFLAAAKVGGIKANSDFPAQFIYDNLMIQNNIIHNAYKFGVKKLLFLGSSCIYPKNCSQPIKEEYLLTGELEKTNEFYALAKIAGLKMCEAYNREYGTNFISCMPTNLYGPNDNFDLNSSHVLPALIAKFLKAKETNAQSVVIWGSGKPMREFLFVDDLAEALVFLMQNYDSNETINVGTGEDISILDLANLIAELVGFSGSLIFDQTKPDGTMRKVLDVSKINNLGWRAKTSLCEGILKTIEWYVTNNKKDLECCKQKENTKHQMLIG